MDKIAYQRKNLKALRLLHRNGINLIPLVTVLQHPLRRQESEKENSILESY